MGRKLKIKVFVSVPMKGRAEQEIKEHINSLYQREVKALIKHPHIAISSPDEMELIDTFITETPPDNVLPKYWYRRESIKLLFDANIIIMGMNYDEAPGCMAELTVAQYLGKIIKYE